jgi:hypothetical protein
MEHLGDVLILAVLLCFIVVMAASIVSDKH